MAFVFKRKKILHVFASFLNNAEMANVNAMCDFMHPYITVLVGQRTGWQTKPIVPKGQLQQSVKKDLEIFCEMKERKKSDNKTTHPCFDVAINHLNPQHPYSGGNIRQKQPIYKMKISYF